MDIAHTPKRFVAAALLAAGLTVVGIGLAAGDAHAYPAATATGESAEHRPGTGLIPFLTSSPQ